MPIIIGDVGSNNPGLTCDPSNQGAWIGPQDLADCLQSASPRVDLRLICRAATRLCEKLSGLQYGQRPAVLRPLVLNAACGCWAGFAGLAGDFPWGGWGWLANPRSLDWSSCGCSGGSEVDLGRPALVTEVRVGGVALAASAWELQDWRRLVRLDGGSFPCCQRPSASPPALELDAVVGGLVQDDAALACAEVACELLKAAASDSSCRLPRRVQNVTRQNLSVSFVDPSQVLAQGFTGLPLVDLWLGSLDAAAKRSPGRVTSLSELTREASR